MTGRVQKLTQADRVGFLDRGMAEAGVQPERVAARDQGNARLLTFPAGTDVARGALGDTAGYGRVSARRPIPFDYAPVRVSYPGKGFEATAWLWHFGYSGRQVSSPPG